MSWNRTILDTARPGDDLPRKIEALLSQQRASWKALRDGEAALSGMRSKVFYPDRPRVVVQANPGRRGSTHARVDPQSIARRACFLCPENMPAAERGIGFEEFVVLPNPHPILRRHCTIPAREHHPQLLAGRIKGMIALARAVGPDMLVFYNGARCGASAPDHFHFQACCAAGVPLLTHLPLSGHGDDSFPYTSFGRRMLVFNDRDEGQAGVHISEALEALSALKEEDAEPMLNVLALFRDGRHLIVLFPRAAHRPDCYFADGDARIAISPAALEMAGILVVAETEHFERVDAETARSIYEEVSLDAGRFTRLVEAVT